MIAARRIVAAALLACVVFGAAASAAERPLKVLLVGNSFAWSLRRYLPDVAKSVEGCDLVLEIAHIGGCSLERHIREYERTLTDPNHRPYTDISGKAASLNELLVRQKWDIVSIQQASHLSWRAESFQPWADRLIAIIRETSPQAEIVVQETWSYNDGDPRIHGSTGTWGITRQQMYDLLAANYRRLARENGFRLVPTGLAVQLSRADDPQQFPVITPELRASFHYPCDLPKSTDMVGKVTWWDRKRDGNRELVADMIHLNSYGEYMQACLWFSFLFGRDVEEIAFRPKLDRERIDKARRCARLALEQEKQAEKAKARP